MTHILIVGNVVDGLTFYGPYGTAEEANQAGDERFAKEEWWVTALQADHTSWLGKSVYVDTGDGVDGAEYFGRVSTVTPEEFHLAVDNGDPRIVVLRWDQVVHMEVK